MVACFTEAGMCVGGVEVVMVWTPRTLVDNVVKEVDRDVRGMRKVCNAACGRCGLGVVAMTRNQLI